MVGVAGASAFREVPVAPEPIPPVGEVCLIPFVYLGSFCFFDGEGPGRESGSGDSVCIATLENWRDIVREMVGVPLTLGVDDSRRIRVCSSVGGAILPACSLIEEEST